MRVTPAPHRRGFSLLELMVALTLGGIAITSIYAVGAASTRTFHQQHQVATTQSSLRIAMGQIKRDFGRAGFMATPNANGPMCQTIAAPLHAPAPTGNGSLAGIARYDSDFCGNTTNGCDNISRVVIGTGGSTTGVDTDANKKANFVGDSVVMMGNYDTASEYAGVRLLGGNSSIAVGATWHAFQTDFMQWVADAPTTFDSDAFNAVFPVGRLIRIRTTKGQYHFATVTGVVAPNLTANPPMDAQIAFAPAVPAACATDVDGAWVAPVNFIRYYPRNTQNNDDAEKFETSGPAAQLIRQETQPAAKLTAFALANGPLAERVVLDYLVAFRLRFILNTVPISPTGATIDVYKVGPGNSDGDVNATPEMVRAVYIDLAARTPEQDRSLAWSEKGCGPETPGSIGRCFLVFGNRPGSARVRSLHAEVFLPNIAFEGY
jgi:prepilin-type N-terminal cleavage/methylation domain-containing protein